MASHPNTKLPTSKQYKRASVETWAQIQADYEMGIGPAELSLKYPMVTIHAIHRRSKQWERGKYKPLLDKRIVEKNIEHAAELGCTPQRLLYEYVKIAFLRANQYISHANEDGITMKKWNTIDHSLVKNVIERRGRDGDTWIEIVPADKMHCMDKLGEYFGLWKNNAATIPPTVQNNTLNIIQNQSNNIYEIQQRYQNMLKNPPKVLALEADKKPE